MNRKITKNIAGMIVLEPYVIMILFIFIMILANNGVVNVIRQEWLSVAESAALAGAGTLFEELGETTANQDALDEAQRLALMHSWMGGAIDEGQVTITLGLWQNCIFTPDTVSPNAVRVDVSKPLNSSGNPAGLTVLFGAIDLPPFQRLESPITAVGVVYEDSAVLVEYQGNVCIN